MAPIGDLFEDYASYHRTPGNKFFHRLGIPMIMLSLFGMLARVVIFRTDQTAVDLAVVLITLTSLFYLTLEWRLAALMLATSVIFYLIGREISLPLNVGLFVLGWIRQFVGHGVYEKKAPAFARNLVHLLIGPLWILNDAFRIVKPRQVAVPHPAS